MTADWQNYLVESETSRLLDIDSAIVRLTDERRALMNRAKQRKHRANLVTGKSRD